MSRKRPRKTRTRRKPTAAQLRARRKFAAMARARAASNRPATSRRRRRRRSNRTPTESRTMSRHRPRRRSRRRSTARRYSTAPRARRRSSGGFGGGSGGLGKFFGGGVVPTAMSVGAGLLLPSLVLPRLPANFTNTAAKSLAATVGLAAVAYMIGKKAVGPKNAGVAAATIIGKELAVRAAALLPAGGGAAPPPAGQLRGIDYGQLGAVIDEDGEETGVLAGIDYAGADGE